jgi:DNA modification methylase
MNTPLTWHNEKRKVDDLLPFQHNPRKLSDEKRELLVKSIEKFNLVEIPVINLDDTLIAGHQRCKILQLLGRGQEEIDVRVPNRQLTDQEFKEYNITSNVQVGVWDVDILNDVFEDIDLSGLGLDLDSLPGSDAEMLTQEEEELPFDDTPPLDPITVQGDLYELVSVYKDLKHRIHCGNSKDSDAVAILMEGKKASMVFTDPPYNVKVNDILTSSAKKHKNFKEAAGEMTPEEFIQWLKDVFINLILFSTPGSIHFICMDWKHIYEVISAGREMYTKYMNLCIWNKDNGGMGSFYRSKHELVFVFKNGEEKHINNFKLGGSGRYRTNVWDYAGCNSFGNKEKEMIEDHPTPKPVEMVADAILDCSYRGNIVLELFLGSGSTLIASEITKRNCFAQDLEEKYCDLSVRRWVKYMRDNKLEYKVYRNGEELLEPEIDAYFEK